MGRIDVSIGGQVWTPTPPSSYGSSGVITTAVLEPSMGGHGAGLGQATFHPSWQHVTKTPSGDMFAVVNYYDSDNGVTNQEHATTHFRLWWATQARWAANPATAFQVIYDSNVSGQIEPDYGMAPHIESDVNGNVYLVVNHYPRSTSSSSTNVTKIHKFAPPYTQTYTDGNYGTGSGTLIGTIPKASNKFSAFYDQVRQWIWISFWQNDGTDNLYAVDLNGTQQYSKAIYNVKPGVETYGTATYQCLSMAIDGTLIVGWTSEGTELIQPSPNMENFYDALFIHSNDGGATFKGPGGTITLPVYADNSGGQPANRYGYSLTHPGVDHLDGGDPSYGNGSGQMYNWTHLLSLAFNNGKLHANYESESSSAAVYGGVRMPHVRMDWATKIIDWRLEPDFNTNVGDPGNGGNSYHTAPGNTGSFVQDTSQNGPLFYVSQGRADQGNLGKLVVLKCANPAAASPVWTTYAKMSTSIGSTPAGTPSDGTTGNGVVNISACRWVQEDGSILVVCQQADTPYASYLARII